MLLLSGGCTLPTCTVHGPRRLVFQRLVPPLLIVEGEILLQPSLQQRHRLVTLQVQLFVLDRAPEAFDPHVVEAASLAIHAHRYTSGLETTRPGLGRELHTLVAVEHLRLALAHSL